MLSSVGKAQGEQEQALVDKVSGPHACVARHHHEDVEHHVVDHESDLSHFHELPHDVYNLHQEVTPLEYMHDFGHHDLHVVPKSIDSHLEFGDWGEHVPLPDYHHW